LLRRVRPAGLLIDAFRAGRRRFAAAVGALPVVKHEMAKSRETFLGKVGFVRFEARNDPAATLLNA
jgi:hypothetical protein